MIAPQPSNSPTTQNPPPFSLSVPHHVGAFPVVLPLLRHMLALCRHKWVCDFLFTTDPSHLTVLTAPLLTANALTYDVTITNLDPDPAASTPPRQHLDASFVFVPAFSVSHISVGFGMQENRYICLNPHDFCHPQQPLRATSNALDKEKFRYVRDDRSGLLIMVYDCPSDPFVRIDYMAHQSSICRLRSRVHIARDALQNAFRTGNGVLDADNLFPALLLFQGVHEYRPCPTCGATADSPCECSLDLVVPAHSMDFANGPKQMSSHIGAFQGLANRQLFAKGNALKSGSHRCRIQVQDGAASDLVARLTKWAISEHFKDVPENPLASMLPVECVNVDTTKTSDGGRSLESTNFDTGNNVDRGLLDGFMDNPVQHSENTGAQLLPEMLSIIQLDSWPDADFTTGLPRPLVHHECDLPNPSEPDHMADHDPTSWDPMGTSQGSSLVEMCLDQTFPAVGNTENDLHDGLDLMHTTLNCEERHDHHSLPPKTNTRPIEIHSGQHSPGEESLPTLRRQSNSPTQDDVSKPLYQNGIHEKAKLKELKKQLKRERNRASARRSNTKKKHENDARKQERQRLKNLEVKLRDEEQRLRRENLVLRKELLAQGVPLT